MDETLQGLRDRLVADGKTQLQLPVRFVPFTQDPLADALLNDLQDHPHAYLMACLADRQSTAERAWMVPHIIRERTGSFEMSDLVTLTKADWVRIMRDPTPAHRFPEKMAGVMHLAVQRVTNNYQGDASSIWRGNPSSASVVRRFLEFHGAGPKIATMAANILVREFHIPLSDFRYIDISADSHIMRVMQRLGFVERGLDKPEIFVYAARDLNPDFPGIFDLALWELGRKVCRPTKPLCPECTYAQMCSYAFLEAGHI